MIKKALVAAGSALLILTFLFGRDVASYIGTSLSSIRDAVRQQIPLEFELERARGLIADLTPEIRRNMRVIDPTGTCFWHREHSLWFHPLHGCRGGATSESSF